MLFTLRPLPIPPEEAPFLWRNDATTHKTDDGRDFCATVDQHIEYGVPVWRWWASERHPDQTMPEEMDWTTTEKRGTADTAGAARADASAWMRERL